MGHCLNCLTEYDGVKSICPYCGYKKGTPPKAMFHIYPGSILHGRYEIGTVIGTGGFGITYRAWDVYQNIPVAVKEYYPQGTAHRAVNTMSINTCAAEKIHDYEKGIENFLEEGRALMSFNEVAGIVQVHDFFEQNNTAYIIMEFLRGETLNDYSRHTSNILPYDQAINALYTVMDSLGEIHKIGMIHRDISPDNIFLCTDGSIKLIDFGAARNSKIGDGSMSVLLKPNYAPPEQFNRKGHQGPWTDIYALGATMYRLLTGRMPSESVGRIVEDDLLEPLAYNRQIDPIINYVIMKCLNLKVEDRFQSIDEMRAAIYQGFSQRLQMPVEIVNNTIDPDKFQQDTEVKNDKLFLQSDIKTDVYSKSNFEDKYKYSVYYAQAHRFMDGAKTETELNQAIRLFEKCIDYANAKECISVCKKMKEEYMKQVREYNAYLRSNYEKRDYDKFMDAKRKEDRELITQMLERKEKLQSQLGDVSAIKRASMINEIETIDKNIKMIESKY